eukprot:5920467-Alexandrium_andersonii.AAC.1
MGQNRRERFAIARRVRARWAAAGASASRQPSRYYRLLLVVEARQALFATDAAQLHRQVASTLRAS